jgi:hypothetical protein
MLRSDVLRAIDVMAVNDDCTDEELVHALVGAGFAKLDSKLLVCFVPLAFSRPVLERLGVTDIAESFSVMTRAGRWVQMPLTTQPVYVLAASIMGDPETMAAMSNVAFKRVVTRCPMLNAANHALNTGSDVTAAACAVAFTNLTAEELGYLSWWSKLRRAVFG